MRHGDWLIAIGLSVLFHAAALASQSIANSMPRPAGEPLETMRFEVALLAPPTTPSQTALSPVGKAAAGRPVPSPPVAAPVPRPDAPAMERLQPASEPDSQPEYQQVALQQATERNEMPAVSAPPVPVRAQGLDPIRPVYPWRARRLGQQGKVVVRATYDEDGALADIEVARSSGYGMLDREALGAVRRASPRSANERELLEIVFQLED